MKSKTYLITGASGFLGKALTAQLYAQGHHIIALARNETALIALKEDHPNIHIVTADCADACRMRQLIKGIDGIFHLAAMKHVGLAETQSRQCVLSNVMATNTLLECTDQKKYDFIIGISTDKAAQVSGAYGASKMLMEYLFSEAAAHNPQTKYRIVRYGNVLYSSGSVLVKWKKLLQEGQPITITDPNATRFFWTVQQAIDLIFDCLENTPDCKPYCPSMKAMSVGNLLTAMHQKYGKGQLKINTIGLQTGENLHEKILEDGPYSNQVEQYTIDEITKLI